MSVPRPKSPHQRKQERFRKHYGSKAYLAAIHAQPCEGCGTEQDIEASHIRSKGAGGTWRDLVAKCRQCHREWHNWGRFTWCERKGVLLEQLELAATLNVAKFGGLV